MIHPTIPCLDELKPILKKVLFEIENRMSLAHYPDACINDDYKDPSYICDILGGMQDSNKYDARRHIQSSIDDFALEDWLAKNDPDFKFEVDYLNGDTAKIHYADSVRVGWLQWLIAN